MILSFRRVLFPFRFWSHEADRGGIKLRLDMSACNTSRSSRLHAELSRMRSSPRYRPNRDSRTHCRRGCLERLNTAHAFFEALFAAYLDARLSLPFAFTRLLRLRSQDARLSTNMPIARSSTTFRQRNRSSKTLCSISSAPA